MKRNNNLEMVTGEDLPEGKDGEDGSEKSDSEILDEQTREEDQRKKRLCYKIDKLFNLLYEDLHLLCEWENDEKKRGANDKT